MADHEPRDFARAVREAYQRTDTGDDAAQRRLLERLSGAPAPGRAGAWWRGRVAIGRGTPMRAALVAAGLLVLVGGGLVSRAVDRSHAPAARSHAPAVAGDQALVRFDVRAPGAGGVALVGDFNDWDPAATPMRRDDSADRWSVSLPVTRGRHVYGFVVDRHRWLADPAAPLAPGDGFGSPSSVIVVGGGS
jgi:hypothetical protein